MQTKQLAACVAVLVLPSAALAQITGPSSSQSPYLVPVASAPGVQTLSLITVGDTVGGYPFAGIPDGMGAYKRGPTSRNFGLLVNHEIQATQGAVHAHGQIGSFVSFWGINPATFSVILGRDHITNVITSGSPVMGRLCSGDLANRIAFFQAATPASAEPHIFLSGEEVGAEGRVFAHIVTGVDQRKSYELPYLGRFSWENAVARPFASTKTVVIGTDDSTPGQVYVYIGDKQASGTILQVTGLEGGSLFGVRVPGSALEDRTTILNGATRFELANLGDVSGKTGVQIQADSAAASVTEFLRPEDGCWDPAQASDFYFVTTDRFNSTTAVGRSRLFRLRFDDVNNPELGGTIDTLLDGTEGQQMMDNMCIDRRGHLLIQEDPGNNAHIAKVWQYNLATDALKLIAEHDPARFVTGTPAFLTQDEESSGIFDATDFIGPGWFIANVQAHGSPVLDPTLVEGGQLLAIFNPDSQ